MDISERLDHIRRNKIKGVRVSDLESVAASKEYCEEMVKYFDIDMFGEVDPLAYVQTVLLDINDDAQEASVKRVMGRMSITRNSLRVK